MLLELSKFSTEVIFIRSFHPLLCETEFAIMSFILQACVQSEKLGFSSFDQTKGARYNE